MRLGPFALGVQFSIGRLALSSRLRGAASLRAAAAPWRGRCAPWRLPHARSWRGPVRPPFARCVPAGRQLGAQFNRGIDPVVDIDPWRSFSIAGLVISCRCSALAGTADRARGATGKVAPASEAYLAAIERHLCELAAATQRLIDAEKSRRALQQDRRRSWSGKGGNTLETDDSLGAERQQSSVSGRSNLLF